MDKQWVDKTAPDDPILRELAASAQLIDDYIKRLRNDGFTKYLHTLKGRPGNLVNLAQQVVSESANTVASYRGKISGASGVTPMRAKVAFEAKLPVFAKLLYDAALSEHEVLPDKVTQAAHKFIQNRKDVSAAAMLIKAVGEHRVELSGSAGALFDLMSEIVHFCEVAGQLHKPRSR